MRYDCGRDSQGRVAIEPHNPAERVRRRSLVIRSNVFIFVHMFSIKNYAGRPGHNGSIVAAPQIWREPIPRLNPPPGRDIRR